VKGFLRSAVPIAAVFALAACSGSGSSSALPGNTSQLPGSSQSQSSASSAQQLGYQRACNELARPGFARCEVLFRSGVGPGVSGWGATDLQSAYNLPVSMGSGQVIAAVDAYDQPNIVSDIQKYDTQYGLPAANFAKYNQNGQQSNYPSPNQGWGLEESLDVDMLSAGCPLCKIILVEANGADFSDLEKAVATAASLGATVISNSYSGGGANAGSYNIPGVTILASAGDSGYGISDPAAFNTVVSVGGTVLTKGGGTRGWSETAWSGTGSGCASGVSKPSWQKAKWTPGCSNRVANDVSAVALNVALYDSYGYGGWVEVGGTSISSPLNGAIFGLAGNSTSQSGGKTFWLKTHHKFLYDITTGHNGTCTPSYLCTAGPGYDGPTGWGTPNGIGAY